MSLVKPRWKSMFPAGRTPDNGQKSFAPPKVAVPQKTPREERINSWKVAKVFSTFGYSVEGVVLDHSSTGLRLRFRTIESLPELVHVRVSDLKIDVTARIVWTDHSDIGVEFVGPPPAQPERARTRLKH